MDKKAYERIGLTVGDVLEIQEWLFPMMNETATVSEMIINTIDQFGGIKRHYALYLLGNEIGQASVKEQLGVPHVLNAKNI
jgi:hypothetical protein